MKQCILLVLIGVLAACGGTKAPLPTNAPVIPATATATPTQTHTPMPTLNPAFPTVDAAQPTWTPAPSDTPAPTRTPHPSSTPLPSKTAPPSLRSGSQTLADGSLQIIISVDDLNTALRGTPYAPSLQVEPDAVWVHLTLHNDFLNQDSQVRARVGTRFESSELVFHLDDFSAQGPAVTRDQVRAALVAVSPAINAAIATETAAQPIRDLTFASGFIILTVYD